MSFQYAEKDVFVLHGSFFNTSEFIFKSTAWGIKQGNFEAASANVILAGHCGVPFHDLQSDKYWFNAGVIGMPAIEGTTRVWYMILDDQDGFKILSLFFPI
ncbi:MAG: hypothetical protein RIC35_13540 [Marinoscillum sp.]